MVPKSMMRSGLAVNQSLEVERIAAAGQTAEFGKVAGRRREERLFGFAWCAHPADHLFRRQNVEQDGGGRSGREDARDGVGDRHLATRRVCDGARLYARRRRQNEGETEKRMGGADHAFTRYRP